MRSWWAGFTLQTKLMALITLMVSLLMSGVTFWAVNDIQTDARLSDTRFGRDLGLLLADNVAPLVARDDRTEIARLSKNFYDSSSSIRYIIYADPGGEIYFGIPFSANEVQSSLSLRRRIQVPEDPRSDRPLVRQHHTPEGIVTDVFVNISFEGQKLGILAVGINPNPAAVASSSLTLNVTTAVFVSIWSMVILGAATNTLIITKPIKELATGVKSIASGNFQQRIDLPFGGELGELIRSFNEMAMRLKSYEEQNIEELTAEKAKLETLVSTIADGAILLDSEMKVVLVNPAAAKLFCWEQANEVYETPNLLTVASLGDDNSKAKAIKPEQSIPNTINHTLVNNITETKSETVTPDQEAQQSALVALVDQIDQIDQIEPAIALANHKGSNDKGVVGMNILQALPEAIATEISRPLLLIASGEQETGEYRITTAADAADSGSLTHTLRIWITTVVGSDNSLKGIAMTVQDITREVELNAAQARFISNVSHELRTPLFNIKSFIETLYEYGDELSEEQQRDFLDTANRETDRLTRLVNDVLDLSRLESARQYHFDATDITQPIEQTMRTYQLNAKDKGIELIKEVADDLPKVWGNYDLLLQVLANLVGNGLKFTDAGGKVILRAYAWQDQNATAPNRSVSRVRIEIEDTGIGIAPDDQTRIFNRFYRVENLVHTLEGTGLGLSIVKNIIDKHHSQIHIRSEVGKGTCFWFDLGVLQEKCDLNPEQHQDHLDSESTEHSEHLGQENPANLEPQDEAIANAVVDNLPTQPTDQPTDQQANQQDQQADSDLINANSTG